MDNRDGFFDHECNISLFNVEVLEIMNWGWKYVECLKFEKEMKTFLEVGKNSHSSSIWRILDNY